MKSIIIHLKQEDIECDFSQWHLELYKIIEEFAKYNSIGCERRLRDKDIKVGTRSISDNRFSDGNLHILDDRSVCHPNVLNAGVAYLWGFWHLDLKGVKAFSSIADLDYEEDRIPEHDSKVFYKTLSDSYICPRLSKYEQNKEINSFPNGSVGLFMQGDHPKKSGVSKYSDIDILDMLIQTTSSRKIVVKPHPLSSNVDDILEVSERSVSDKRIIITDANIHDILESVDFTVSNNSTVALEGFLYNKPALVFGRCDFHHSTINVDDKYHLSEILKEPLKTINYGKYLYWYFKMNCFDAREGDKSKIYNFLHSHLKNI